MPSEPKNKIYSLQPSWKYYFWQYLLAVLTIPVFGLGLILLYWIWKKHHNVRYEVTDDQISVIQKSYRRNVDLFDIEMVEISRSWMEEKLGIGSIILHTSALEIELYGINNPGTIGNILEKAIQALQEQKHTTRPRATVQNKYDPGSMEKMDYLTGLWQQGLLSDEDFQKERKHFED